MKADLNQKLGILLPLLLIICGSALLSSSVVGNSSTLNTNGLTTNQTADTYIPKVTADSNVTIDGTITANEYPVLFVDSNTGIEVYWEHNSTDILVGLVINDFGWVAIGFGTVMANANMIMGGVDTGVPYGVDRTGVAFDTPTDDTTDNIKSFDASENATSTIFEFVFPLDGGDSADPAIVEGTIIDFFVAADDGDDIALFHDLGRSDPIPKAFVDDGTYVPPVPSSNVELDYEVAIPYNDSGIVTVDGVIAENEYSGYMEDRTTKIDVYWEHDGTQLKVGLVSPNPGTGWVALGIGEAMLDSNMIMGGFDPDRPTDPTYCVDLVGIAGFKHKEDGDTTGSTDITACEATEADGRTTLEFIIPFNTGDTLDPILETGSVFPMFLAYHQSSDSITTQHTAHSKVFTALIRPEAVIVPTSIDLVAPLIVNHGEKFEMIVNVTANDESYQNATVIFYIQAQFGQLDLFTGYTNESGMANFTYSNPNLLHEVVLGARIKERLVLYSDHVDVYPTVAQVQEIEFMKGPDKEAGLYRPISRIGLITAFWIAGIIIWGSFMITLYGIVEIFQDRNAEVPGKEETPAKTTNLEQGGNNQ
jgi:hypothetical protein